MVAGRQEMTLKRSLILKMSRALSRDRGAPTA